MTEYFIHVKKDGEPMYQNCESFQEAIGEITDFDVEMDEELAQLLETCARELDNRLYEGLPIKTCVSTMQEQLRSCATYWEIEASCDEMSYVDDDDEDDW
jgi:hypothetical protein